MRRAWLGRHSCFNAMQVSWTRINNACGPKGEELLSAFHIKNKLWKHGLLVLRKRSKDRSKFIRFLPPEKKSEIVPQQELDISNAKISFLNTHVRSIFARRCIGKQAGGSSLTCMDITLVNVILGVDARAKLHGPPVNDRQTHEFCSETGVLQGLTCLMRMNYFGGKRSLGEGLLK